MAVNELKEVGLILFPLLMLAAMIYQAVTFINPMVHGEKYITQVSSFISSYEFLMNHNYALHFSLDVN